MPDPRFFEDLGPITVGDLIAVTGATPVGAVDSTAPIAQVAPLDRADGQSATFFAGRAYRADLARTRAAACFLPVGDADLAPTGCARLATSTPQAAYAAVAARLHRPRRIGSSPSAIDPSAEIEEGVILSHGVVVGPRARIGRGSAIGPNTVVGPGVCIGRECSIAANVTIGFALIGDHVRVLAGAVIGEPGFGVGASQMGAIDMPQLGRVILQDGVSVGANACIDRGAWDDTVIGENTKIDNLVQIGHNTQVGRSCMFAGHTGISGSVVIGDFVQLGGRVGVSDHVSIGSGARLAANTAVIRDIAPGETMAGFPAVPSRQWLRQVVYLNQIGRGRSAGAAS